MKLADLGRKSVRRNALIADLLHHIDFIEKAGTGIKRIRDDVHAQGCPEPAFENNGFFTAIFRPNPEVRGAADAESTEPAAEVVGAKPAPGWQQVAGEVAGEVTGEVTGEVLRLLQVLATSGPMTRAQAQEALSLRSEANFRDRYLAPALSSGLVEMTIPEKPRSRLQQYRLTRAGLKRLKQMEEL